MALPPIRPVVVTPGAAARAVGWLRGDDGRGHLWRDPEAPPACEGRVAVVMSGGVAIGQVGRRCRGCEAAFTRGLVSVDPLRCPLCRGGKVAITTILRPCPNCGYEAPPEIPRIAEDDDPTTAARQRVAIGNIVAAMRDRERP